jgi:hypothetical protein
MDEPAARRTLFAASRAAATELWGDDGIAQIAERLPEDARRDTIESVVVTTEWLPERYMMAWYEAVWAAPARSLVQQFRRFIDKRMSHGFDRVRKSMLSQVTPEQLVTRAPDLWRHDHTTGTLTVEMGANAASVTLLDHPYATTRVARMATAEVYRHALSMLSASRNVVETHTHEKNGSLVVRLTWQTQ